MRHSTIIHQHPGLILCLCLALNATAALAVDERTVISVDRTYYCAGEEVFVSLWCLDLDSPMRTGSELSSIAYIEILNSEGMAVSGKAALLHGRGAASVLLPEDLPTGNYRICAYTSLEKERNSPEALLAGARTISVFNTLTTSRVKDGVRLLEKGSPIPAGSFPRSSGGVELLGEGEGKVLIRSPRHGASLSVTMYKEDGLPSYESRSLATILSGLSSSQRPTPEDFVPEYDGEIIRVNLTGADGNPLLASTWEELFLSSPGNTSDIYSGRIRDGKATFYTTNIFGDKDLVFTMGSEVSRDYSPVDKENLTGGFNAVIQSPFLGMVDKDIPQLLLSGDMAPVLTDLNVSMQIGQAFRPDTLFSSIPHRDIPFTGKPGKSYILDDYTRFPTMEEVIIEFVTEMRARRDKDGRTRLDVRNQRSFRGPTYYTEGPSLILLDGVPVPDHASVYGMDPLLVKRIDIYPWRYSLGRLVYEGVANFVTYKGNMASTSLGNRTRIVSFKGASVSRSFSFSSARRGETPRLGRTLMWNPAVEVGKGEEIRLTVPEMDYGGDIRVVVEGVDDEGRGIFETILIKR